MIGSPIATTEPKVSSRIDDRRQQPDENGDVGFFFAAASSIGWPPSSTWSPSPEASWAIEMISFVVVFVELLLVVSNWTVA